MDGNRYGLNEKQSRFVALVTTGAELPDALRKAGYTHTHFYDVLDSPRIKRAIDDALRNRLRLDGAPLAIEFLITVLRDEDTDKRLRVDVARTLLDRAGIAPVKLEAPGEPLNPHDMTTDEIRAMLRGMERELGGRATLIGPDASAIDEQVSDLM